MSDKTPVIHESLLPDAIRDERGEALRETLQGQLGTIDVTAHLLTNPYTVDAKFLPFMAIERSLEEYMFPGMREEHLRRLIDFAPEIHAEKGTVSGVRRALEAFNLSMHWVQWFQEEPKAPHDTHKVKVFFNEALVDGNALASEDDKNVVTRIINATQRWSQFVAVQFGVQRTVPLFYGVFSIQRGRSIAGVAGNQEVLQSAVQRFHVFTIDRGLSVAGMET